MAQQLYITHPDAHVNDRQRQELEILSGEAQTFMARMFVLGNAAIRYYQQLTEAPTEQDYQQWLMGLPDHIAANKRAKGYQACKKTIPLLRFALELRDIGMTDYMRSNLHPKDFQHWIVADAN